MAQHWGAGSPSGERRLAEEFELALIGAAAPDAHGAAQAGDASHRGARHPAAPAVRTATLVGLAHRMEQSRDALPAMDEAFRARLRERLVLMAPEVAAQNRAQVPAQRGGRHAGVRRPAAARPSRGGASAAAGAVTGISAAWRRRLLAAGVGVAVATGSIGGIAIASAGAVPGDPLYSAKKMFENIQLSLSGSPTDRGSQYLRLADTRLGEIDSLLQRPDAGVPGSATEQYLAQALDDLQSMIGDGGALLLDQVRAAGDQQAVHVLSDFLLTERQRVKDLTWQLPQSLQGRPAQIVALMDDLYGKLQRAAAAMPKTGPAPSASAGTGGQGGQSTGPGGPGGQSANPDGTPQHSAAQGGPGGGASSAGASGAAGSPNASPSASASPSPTDIGVKLPLPILPSIGVNLPPLLPGLPGINVDLGGSDPGATPSK